MMLYYVVCFFIALYFVLLLIHKTMPPRIWDGIVTMVLITILTVGGGCGLIAFPIACILGRKDFYIFGYGLPIALIAGLMLSFWNRYVSKQHGDSWRDPMDY